MPWQRLPFALSVRSGIRAAASLVLCLLVTTPTYAQARCGADGKPWLSVVLAWTDARDELQGLILKDLRAGFAARDIDVCAAAEGPVHAPAARVLITAQSDEALRVRIEIQDTVTQKRGSRDMNLERVPKDGRAFAIALAADELVWASWAELALLRTQPRKRGPPQVERGVHADLPRPRREPWRVLARVAGERFSGGQAHWGFDAGLLWPVWRALELELMLGAREGLKVEAPNGEISSAALGGTLAMHAVALRKEGFRFGAVFASRVAVLSLRGAPDPGVAGAAISGVLWVGRVGLSVRQRIVTGLWLDVGAGLGLPLKAVEATADGVVQTGASGAEGFAGFGLGVQL